MSRDDQQPHPLSKINRSMPRTARLNLVVSTRTFLPLVGGAELGIHEIYKRLATEHDVTILTRPHPPAVLRHGAEADVRPAGYRVLHVMPWADRLPWQLSHYPRLMGATVAAAIARLHRRRPIDALNAHFVRSHLVPLRVARRLGIRTVLSLAGRDDVLGSLPRWKQAYMRATCASADLVVPNSEQYLTGTRIRAATRTIPYGVDPRLLHAAGAREDAREALGLTQDALVLLAVQRLVAVKRVDLLISALPSAKRQIGAIQLIVVGRGPEERSLRALTARLEVEDTVRFAGHVAEDVLPLYYAAADCLVSHSMAETFGMTFAEAMAAGLPVLAARTSGAVPPGDADLFEPFDLEGLVKALRSLKDDPAPARVRAARNREHARRNFDWDVIAEDYLRALTGTSRQRGPVG